MRTVPDKIARKLVDGADHLDMPFDAVTMDDIATASGIPRATLYYHFRGKTDVLRFVHQALLAEYRATVRADDDGPALERLETLFRRLLEHMGRHRGTGRLFVANLGELGEWAELTTGTFDPLAEQLERVLGDGVRSRELKPLDVARTAFAVSAMAHAAVTRALLADAPIDPDELAAWFVTVVGKGIAAPAS
jgi:AcrR family transcriptional regulator